jgi:PPOX class probable F420-dependent enzyme
MAFKSDEERDAFLRVTRIAKLGTINLDGSPNIVPVWYEWDGEVARVFTSRKSPKARRIQRDPRVVLTVEEPVGVRENWLSIEGDAQFVDEGTLALARRLAERYYTPERFAETWPGWEAMGDEWVTLVITPRRFRSENYD